MRIKRKTGKPKKARGGFRPGQTGNPRGSSEFQRKIGGTFKKLIRDLMDTKSPMDRETIKEELVEVAIRKARRGNFFFWSKLVDLHETEFIGEDDLQHFIERVYVTVRRHVEKLDGGKQALAEIARDLQKENEQ